MTRPTPAIPLWAPFLLILIPVSLLTRTYIPIDETRYASVAWDMWRHGNFLVPHLNGEPYSDKPPLLFWLYGLGWMIFGVNDIWPRMVSPLFCGASLLLTAGIARRLWPDRPAASRLAPLIAGSSILWAIFALSAMFDMLMVFFTLAGVYGIIRSWQDRGPTGWLILGGALGMGILAKGPVILLNTLPVALLAPWWAVENRPARWLSWYAGMAAAVVMGGLIALAWAIPAARAGGQEYAHAIFWGQSAGRVVKSFAHKRPFWWYVPLLPAILFPWLFWPPLWRALRALVRRPSSSGVRLCLAWMVPVFVIFSLISGKQIHYLLPIFPAFALLSAYALDGGGEHRGWDMVIPVIMVMCMGCVLLVLHRLPLHEHFSRVLHTVNPYGGIVLVGAGPVLLVAYHLKSTFRTALVSLTSLLLIAVLHFSLVGVFERFDMRPMSAYVAGLQRAGVPVGYVGKYPGVFNFLGRMDKPLEVIREKQVLQWAAGHPGGLIIADENHLKPGPGTRPVYESPYGFHVLRVWKSSDTAHVPDGKDIPETDTPD